MNHIEQNHKNSGQSRSLLTTVGLRRMLLASASAALLLLAAGTGATASAAPIGGIVVAGSATISSSGTTTTINQSTNRAVLDWTSFDLAADETANFVIADTSNVHPGVTLNRITGGAATRIDGTVTSNGEVYFVNPNGLVFSATSKIQSNGFLAYAGNITVDEFYKPNSFFNKILTPTLDKTAAIVFDGTAKVSRSVFGLFGPQVSVGGLLDIDAGYVMIHSNHGNLSVGNIRGDISSISLRSGGNITLKGDINAPEAYLSLESEADVNYTAPDRNGTIVNLKDVNVYSLSVFSTGRGSVILKNLHIAELGYVAMRNPSGDKIFNLTNNRDLTINSDLFVYGSVSISTVGSTNYWINSSYRTIRANQPDLLLRPVTVSLRSSGGLYAGNIMSQGQISLLAEGDIVTQVVGTEPFDPFASTIRLGSISITSANGSIDTRNIVYGGNITLQGTRGIRMSGMMGAIQAFGEISLTNGCQVRGCYQASGDIVIAGTVSNLSLPHHLYHYQISGNYDLKIVNNFGNVVIRDSILSNRNITIEANNGSVIQTDWEFWWFGIDSKIQSRAGKIYIKSSSSPDPVGIRLKHLVSGTLSTDSFWYGLPPNTRGEGIELESDSNIVINKRISFFWYHDPYQQSLYSNFGNIRITSSKGSIANFGAITLFNSAFGTVSDISLTALNGSITVGGAIDGRVGYDLSHGPTTEGEDRTGVTVRLTAGAGGIRIDDAVSTVGNISIAAENGGSVTVGSGAVIYAQGFRHYEILPDQTLAITRTEGGDSSGIVTITGHDLTTESGATINADSAITAKMTGNIALGDDTRIASRQLIEGVWTYDTDFANTTVSLSTTGLTSQLTFGTGVQLLGQPVSARSLNFFDQGRGFSTAPIGAAATRPTPDAALFPVLGPLVLPFAE